MALTFSLVDTWEDGKRVHVRTSSRVSITFLPRGHDELEQSENVSAGRLSRPVPTGNSTNCSGCKWTRNTSAFMWAYRRLRPDSHARLHGRYARSVRFDLDGRGGTSRKRAPWMISANSCGLIERSHGEGQVFHRSNNSSGKIYALTEGPYLLAPGEGKPRERYERLLALDRAGERDLVARGLRVLKATYSRTRYLSEDFASRLQFVKHKNEV
jgi:hypothetical protein